MFYIKLPGTCIFYFLKYPWKFWYTKSQEVKNSVFTITAKCIVNGCSWTHQRTEVLGQIAIPKSEETGTSAEIQQPWPALSGTKVAGAIKW